MDFEEQALANGFRAEACAACHGAGHWERPILSTEGYEREDPCSTCEGTGRMWSMLGAMPWITDREMRARVAS